MNRLKMVTTMSVLLALLLAVSPLTAAAAVGDAPAHAAARPFDPSVFGRVLSDEELDEVDGEFWLVAGIAVSTITYLALNEIEADSAQWWIGLGVSAALGAVPFTGGAVAAGAAGTAMQIYGIAGSTLVSELLTTAVKTAVDSYD